MRRADLVQYLEAAAEYVTGDEPRWQEHKHMADGTSPGPRLRPMTFLPASPLSVVLTDRLSITPAGGWPRSQRSRSSITSSLLIVRNRPSSRQRQKYFCTVENGGRSFGRSRHAPPKEATYKSASTTSRRFRLARPAEATRGRGHRRFDQRPFFGGQIVCVARAAALIVRAGGFSPGHRYLRRIMQIRQITAC